MQLHYSCISAAVDLCELCTYTPSGEEQPYKLLWANSCLANLSKAFVEQDALTAGARMWVHARQSVTLGIRIQGFY